jgi:putative addiction module component (TIGR02574 family)
MPYNKEELFNLPIEEKLELVEALWDKIDDELLPVSEEEIKFARERLNLHKQNPSEGLGWSEFKQKIKEKYGF